nr:DUF805 domain-containing protein [Pleionea sp. CnH1-48]
MSRIGRIRYLAYSFGVTFLMAMLLGIVFAITGGSFDNLSGGITMILGAVFYVGIIVLTFVMMIRRLNDLGQSGWLSLLYLIPLLNLLLTIYLVFFPGDEGANKYGGKPVPNTALTWIVGLIAPLVVIIGILAAVAIPAYSDYVQRAQAHQQG